jgi:hypothetical protein
VTNPRLSDLAGEPFGSSAIQRGGPCDSAGDGDAMLSLEPVERLNLEEVEQVIAAAT